MNPVKMNAVKVATMFKAGNIASKQDRSQMMSHLHHHFGKKSFDPTLKAQILCESHTEVFHGIIKYPYNEGGVKEVINFTHKNIAHKVVAQLSQHLKRHGITSPHQVRLNRLILYIVMIMTTEHLLLVQGCVLFYWHIIMIATMMMTRSQSLSFLNICC